MLIAAFATLNEKVATLIAKTFFNCEKTFLIAEKTYFAIVISRSVEL